MELTPSADGSLNAFSVEFGEHYANMGEGAFSEKLGKHIAPVWATLESTFATKAKPPKEAPKAQIWILDLCFGLGYNALLSRLFSAFETLEFCIISIELDRQSLALASTIHALDSSLVAQLDSSRQARIAHNVSLQILWGDACVLLADLSASLAQYYGDFTGFDVIYQDPFSYEKCPSLWDYKHFCKLSSLLKDSGIITTYATRQEIITNATQAGLHAYTYKADPATMDRLYQACATLYPTSTHTSIKRKSSIFSKAPVQILGSRLRA